MPAEDALLFIDSNKYLDLFRIDRGKKLLAPLGEQVAYIFVTKQVVDEVQRNKVSVAIDYINQKFDELKLRFLNIPDHLTGAISEQGGDIRRRHQKIRDEIDSLNQVVVDLGQSIIEQISRSEDEVSKALAPIFERAVTHTSEELQRARERKELGNPPGKYNNPIGDQLTWEQILTHFQGKKRLWIISRDEDYGTVFKGKCYLNRFLQDELNKVVDKPEIYLFQDVVEGLKHFVELTGVKAEKQLTPEDAKAVESEEKSLPQIGNTGWIQGRIINFIEPSTPETRLHSIKPEIQGLALSDEQTSEVMAFIAKLHQFDQALESTRSAILRQLNERVEAKNAREKFNEIQVASQEEKK